MAAIPATTDIDITSALSFQASKDVLQAKYTDTLAWAQWAGQTLQQNIADLNNKLGADVVGDNLAAVRDAVDAIETYAPPSGSFVYNAPETPTYDAIPSYADQELGTILAIPAVEAIDISDAPSTDITFSNTAFTDSMLESLRAKLSADIAAGSTGLGADVETAMFARETARQNSVRAQAYNEITTQFSSRGFDLPPGALLAKQTELNNESTLRLTDSSTGILSETIKAAQAYNATALATSTQLLDLLSRVFDSKIMRDFEAEKTRVTLAIEGFKQVVSVALAKAELNKAAISATVAANDGTVKVFQAEIEGQIAPMKAIAEGNQAKASSYGAAVQAETSNLNAQIIPEELKLKGVATNAQVTGLRAEIVFKEAALAIETAARQLQLETTTIAGLAQSASQMVAAALNGVSVSSSFGWSAGSSVKYDGDLNEHLKIQREAIEADAQQPAI